MFTISVLTCWWINHEDTQESRRTPSGCSSFTSSLRAFVFFKSRSLGESGSRKTGLKASDDAKSAVGGVAVHALPPPHAADRLGPPAAAAGRGLACLSRVGKGVR